MFSCLAAKTNFELEIYAGGYFAAMQLNTSCLTNSKHKIKILLAQGGEFITKKKMKTES